MFASMNSVATYSYGFRLLLFSLVFTVAIQCKPPVKTVPRKVQTGLDTALYAAIIMPGDPVPDLRYARFLAEVKVKDRGWALDCLLPEVQRLALDKTRSIGGNLLLVTKHYIPEPDRSRCHRMEAKAYLVDSLPGMEPIVLWSPHRTLQEADLKTTSNTDAIDHFTNFQFRMLGDFYSRVIFRTLTTFEAKSAVYPDFLDKGLALRLARVQFDLTEVYARRYKQLMSEKEVRLENYINSRDAEHQKLIKELQAEQNQLAAEIKDTRSAKEALAKWENNVADQLEALSAFRDDLVIDLNPPKRPK